MSTDVEGKSLVELLNMLEPAPVPSLIAMTPQTWGWVALAVLLVAAIVLGVLIYQKHRNLNAYRRAALAELQDAGDNAAKIAEVLRRTALAAFPRVDVAGLYGSDWINFLRQSSDKTLFSETEAQALITAPYKVGAPNPSLAQTAKEWIKTHRVERNAR